MLVLLSLITAHDVGSRLDLHLKRFGSLTLILDLGEHGISDRPAVVRHIACPDTDPRFLLQV